MHHRFVGPAGLKIIEFVLGKTARVEQAGVIADIRPAVGIGFAAIIKAGPGKRAAHERPVHDRLPILDAEVVGAAHAGGAVIGILAARGFLVGVLAAKHRLARAPLVNLIVCRDVVVDADDVFHVGIPVG
jgi:hypothetical protein